MENAKSGGINNVPGCTSSPLSHLVYKAYSCIIAYAIHTSTKGKLPLASIYEFLCCKVPMLTTTTIDWKNAVESQVLSKNAWFIMETNDIHPENCVWSINSTKKIEINKTITNFILMQANSNDRTTSEVTAAMDQFAMKQEPNDGEIEDAESATTEVDVAITPEFLNTSVPSYEETLQDPEEWDPLASDGIKTETVDPLFIPDWPSERSASSSAQHGEICRTCGGPPEPGCSLLQPEHHKLQNWLSKYLSVQVSEESGLPHKVCLECLSVIRKWISFSAKCRKLQVSILQAYPNPNNLSIQITSLETESSGTSRQVESSRDQLANTNSIQTLPTTVTSSVENSKSSNYVNDEIHQEQPLQTSVLKYITIQKPPRDLPNTTRNIEDSREIENQEDPLATNNEVIHESEENLNENPLAAVSSTMEQHTSRDEVTENPTINKPNNFTKILTVSLQRLNNFDQYYHASSEATKIKTPNKGGHKRKLSLRNRKAAAVQDNIETMGNSSEINNDEINTPTNEYQVSKDLGYRRKSEQEKNYAEKKIEVMPEMSKINDEPLTTNEKRGRWKKFHQQEKNDSEEEDVPSESIPEINKEKLTTNEIAGKQDHQREWQQQEDNIVVKQIVDQPPVITSDHNNHSSNSASKLREGPKDSNTDKVFNECATNKQIDNPITEIEITKQRDCKAPQQNTDEDIDKRATSLLGSEKQNINATDKYEILLQSSSKKNALNDHEKINADYAVKSNNQNKSPTNKGKIITRLRSKKMESNSNSENGSTLLEVTPNEKQIIKPKNATQVLKHQGSLKHQSPQNKKNVKSAKPGASFSKANKVQIKNYCNDTRNKTPNQISHINKLPLEKNYFNTEKHIEPPTRTLITTNNSTCTTTLEAKMLESTAKTRQELTVNNGNESPNNSADIAETSEKQHFATTNETTFYVQSSSSDCNKEQSSTPINETPDCMVKQCVETSTSTELPPLTCKDADQNVTRRRRKPLHPKKRDFNKVPTKKEDLADILLRKYEAIGNILRAKEIEKRRQQRLKEQTKPVYVEQNLADVLLHLSNNNDDETKPIVNESKFVRRSCRVRNAVDKIIDTNQCIKLQQIPSQSSKDWNYGFDSNIYEVNKKKKTRRQNKSRAVNNEVDVSIISSSQCVETKQCGDTSVKNTSSKEILCGRVEIKSNRNNHSKQVEESDSTEKSLKETVNVHVVDNTRVMFASEAVNENVNNSKSTSENVLEQEITSGNIHKVSVETYPATFNSVRSPQFLGHVFYKTASLELMQDSPDDILHRSIFSGSIQETVEEIVSRPVSPELFQDTVEEIVSTSAATELFQEPLDEIVSRPIAPEFLKVTMEEIVSTSAATELFQESVDEIISKPFASKLLEETVKEIICRPATPDLTLKPDHILASPLIASEKNCEPLYNVNVSSPASKVTHDNSSSEINSKTFNPDIFLNTSTKKQISQQKTPEETFSKLTHNESAKTNKNQTSPSSDEVNKPGLVSKLIFSKGAIEFALTQIATIKKRKLSESLTSAKKLKVETCENNIERTTSLENSSYDTAFNIEAYNSQISNLSTTIINKNEIVPMNKTHHGRNEEIVETPVSCTNKLNCEIVEFNDNYNVSPSSSSLKTSINDKKEVKLVPINLNEYKLKPSVRIHATSNKEYLSNPRLVTQVPQPLGNTKYLVPIGLNSIDKTLPYVLPTNKSYQDVVLTDSQRTFSHDKQTDKNTVELITNKISQNSEKLSWSISQGSSNLHTNDHTKMLHTLEPETLQTVAKVLSIPSIPASHSPIHIPASVRQVTYIKK